MALWDVFRNPVLLSALTAWALAQIIKLPLEVMFRHRWNWAILLSTGGMPSSHAALVSAATLGVGLSAGFQSPLFALAFALAMVVLYDATGIRRHAGEHAKALLDEANRFDTVDQNRRHIAARQRRGPRRACVDDLVILRAQPLASQEFTEHDVDRPLRYVAADHFPSELLDVGDFFRSDQHEIGSI